MFSTVSIDIFLAQFSFPEWLDDILGISFPLVLDILGSELYLGGGGFSQGIELGLAFQAGKDTKSRIKTTSIGTAVRTLEF
jgi:hypothetical protein